MFFKDIKNENYYKDTTLTLYHGSDHPLPNPSFNWKNPDNDYGSGLYTTLDFTKAAEWASVHGENSGYVSTYQIDTTGLNILFLDKYGLLSWVTEVIKNRGARGEASQILGKKLCDVYNIDSNNADIIIGYRADDSYTDVVDSFLKNEISIDETKRLFEEGFLGQQVFIKSEEAFNRLKYIGAKNINNQEYDNIEEIKARKKVFNFLQNRRSQIIANGYIPSGIIAREAAKYFCEYNSEADYYIKTDIEIDNITKEELEEYKNYDREVIDYE